MNALAKILPFVTPEEEGLEQVSRPGFFITERSRIDDAERQAQLERQLDEAQMPEEVEAVLAEMDRFHAEQEADERRAQEEADAQYDEENAKW